MNQEQTGLAADELTLLQSVFRQHPEIEEVILFGSRAKGTARPNSDIDLAVRGNLNTLQTETLAMELDELPLPYQFDVQVLENIRNPRLREYIRRVGIIIYL